MAQQQLLKKGSSSGLTSSRQRVARATRGVQVVAQAGAKWTPPPAWDRRVVVPDIKPRSDPKVGSICVAVC